MDVKVKEVIDGGGCSFWHVEIYDKKNKEGATLIFSGKKVAERVADLVRDLGLTLNRWAD